MLTLHLKIRDFSIPKALDFFIFKNFSLCQSSNGINGIVVENNRAKNGSGTKDEVS